MNLPDAVKSGFQQYATFSGRTRRSEFWYWVLFTVIVSVAAALVDAAPGTGTDNGSGLVQGIVALALLVPNLAVFWRRMHDIDRTGAWWFCLLIPLAQIAFAIVFTVWACRDSDPTTNRFGPPPKTPQLHS